MTASDVERRLTAVLHEHAEQAMNRTDTVTELNKFHARVDQDMRGRGRRRAVTTAAVITAAAAGTGVLWFGFGQNGVPTPVDRVDPVASPSPSTAASETAEEPETPQTPGSTVEGFEGVESFPISYVVPKRFAATSEGSGTRGYTIRGTSGSAGAFLIGTLTQADASELPDDLAAHIRKTRDDVRVGDVRTTEVGGRPAQSFTLTQEPGTTPFDLWCAESGSCFKLLEDKPMDVTAVRTGRGLVLFEVEYLPRDRARVQGPMQAWLSSVSWE